MWESTISILLEFKFQTQYVQLHLILITDINNFFDFCSLNITSIAKSKSGMVFFQSLIIPFYFISVRNIQSPVLLTEQLLAEIWKQNTLNWTRSPLF
jgi:hypothetical protein